MLNMIALKSPLTRAAIAISITMLLLSSNALPPVHAAVGDLDPTFGSGGKVTSDFMGRAFAIAIQPDGKIITAGLALAKAGFVLIRLKPDGNLDPSFGTGGEVTTDLGGDIRALAIQADGKIVAAGEAVVGSRGFDFALARYNSDGSLDTSFGSAGKGVTDFGGNRSNEEAAAVAIQSDGKIVAAGDFFSDEGRRFAIARYNGDGIIFDICIQDDSSGSILQINTTTEEYQFTNCSGFTISGTGSLTKRGSIITLQHTASDRRVMAKFDGGTNKATASIQMLAQGLSFTITDRNTANNTCSCR